MLRHNLIFETSVVTSPEELNAIGEPVETWQEYTRILGAVEYLGSREFPIAQKMYGETIARFRIRYKKAFHVAGWAGRNRINFDGHTWNIAPPVPDTRATIGSKSTTRVRWSVIEGFIRQ